MTNVLIQIINIVSDKLFIIYKYNLCLSNAVAQNKNV